jgi:hypothetical protein
MNRTEIADLIYKGGEEYLEETKTFPWGETLKNEEYLNSFIVRRIYKYISDHHFDYLIGFEIRLSTLMKLSNVSCVLEYDPKYDIVIFKNGKAVSIIEIKRFANDRVSDDFDKILRSYAEIKQIGSIKNIFLGFRGAASNEDKLHDKFTTQLDNIKASKRVPSNKITSRSFHDSLIQNVDGHFSGFGVIHWSI